MEACQTGGRGSNDRREGNGMEQLNPEIIDAAQGLWGSLVTFFKLLWLPSRRNQLIAIAALIGLSWLVARLLSPVLTNWLRNRENWPKWRLRWVCRSSAA